MESTKSTLENTNELIAMKSQRHPNFKARHRQELSFSYLRSIITTMDEYDIV